METQIKAGSFPGSGGGQGLVPGPWRKGLGRPAQESPIWLACVAEDPTSCIEGRWIVERSRLRSLATIVLPSPA